MDIYFNSAYTSKSSMLSETNPLEIYAKKNNRQITELSTPNEIAEYVSSQLIESIEQQLRENKEEPEPHLNDSF